MCAQTVKALGRDALRRRLDVAEEHFRRITELPSFGMLVVDHEFRVELANKWASEITGFDPARIRGMDFLSLFHPPDREVVRNSLFLDGGQDPCEINLVTAGGRRKDVEFSCVGCQDLDGNRRAYVALRDISRRKEMERSAREAHNKMSKIAEMGDVGILVYDQDFLIEFANQMSSEITGYSAEELVGSDITRLLDRENRAYLKGLYSPLNLDEHRRLCMEMPIRQKDSEVKLVEICLTIARGVHGDIKTYTYLRDLTERIQMENELRKTNEFLQKVIRSSVDGIIAADMKGDIIIFNEGAERLLGYHADEVIGRIHITRLYPPGMAKEIMRRLRGEKYGPPGKLPTTPTTLIARSGEHIPVHISAAIVYEKESEIASVGIFTDLRERIKMQQQLEETYNQLLQSEKLASLGKLAAGVAHEINNPLGGILMYSKLLLEQFQDEQPGADLKEIVEQTVRCQKIVQGLLDFARKRGEEKVPVNLNQVLDKAVSLPEKQVLFQNIRIERVLDVQLPPIQADPGQMHQVFTNLIINAAESMEGKGILTLRTWSDHVKQSVHVEISDTGFGIPDEHLARIFDPFFTTKTVGKGTGLGLSTTYGLVRRHGGKIEVVSKVGEGTSFFLQFPLESTAPPHTENQGQAP